jgi:hypothetical protein
MQSRHNGSRNPIVPMLAAVAFCLWTAPAGAQATGQDTIADTAPKPKPPAASGGHYIEFRVATIGAYGHSYAVYGVAGGKESYTDLHPVGSYAAMAVGHVLPVPANTKWDPEVAKLPVASRYRKSLTPDQYRKLLAAVQAAKAGGSPFWNAVSNNCNHYIGKLAAAVGLQVPQSFQVSYSFVPALKGLNEDKEAKAQTPSRKKVSSEPRT